MQAIAGSKVGGAESFFVRLVIALNSRNINQKVIIGRSKSRMMKLQSEGIQPTEISFGGPIDFLSKIKIQKEINEFRPDIILSWMSRAASKVPISGRQITHIGRLGGYYNLKYYKSCDYLIGNTPDIVDYIVEEGFNPKRVIHLPNFVNDPINPPVKRSDLDTPENVPLIFAMGRLHKNKAFDVLLKSMPNIPDAWLWIAGEGPEKSFLKSLVEELGIGERTRFLGWSDKPDALLSAADIFVCPSRHEPLGNVIIEAWAANKPVIAAASMGPKELLGDNEKGLVVPINNPKEIANSVNYLIKNPDKSIDLSGAGLEAYEKYYSEKVVVDQYLKFFEKVLSECAA